MNDLKINISEITERLETQVKILEAIEKNINDFNNISHVKIKVVRDE